MTVPTLEDLLDNFVPTLEDLLDNFLQELGYMKRGVIFQTFNNKIKDRGLEDAFSYIWNLDEAQRCLSPIRIFSEKLDADANRLRELGNKHYKEKKYRKALEYYNMSILAAPHPEVDTLESPVTLEDNFSNRERGDGNHVSEKDQTDYKTLAWGYCNRSAVLLLLKEYKKCLRDVDLALMFGKSEGLQSNLEKRRQKCLELMEKQNAGKESDKSTSKQPVPPKVRQRNPSLPALSNAVSVAFTSRKGRHLVAERNIRPGEILGVEESYCISIEPDYLQTRCSVCLVECDTPLPCPKCTMVVFCSFSCRKKGLQEDHQLECSILPSFLGLQVRQQMLLVFKMLNRTPYVELKRLKPQMDREAREIPSLKRGLNGDGVYCYKDYRSLYHLVTNKERMSPQTLYNNCLTAVVLTKMLEQSGEYFIEDGKPLTPTEKDLQVVGGRLFTHLMQIESNFHKLVLRKVNGPMNVESEFGGMGVFPTLSLMNHSCVPTTTTYSCGRSLVLRSVRSIPAGAEITECYSFPYYAEFTLFRQMVLRTKFQVDCSCEACEKGWPVNALLPNMNFKCSMCQFPLLGILLKCQICHTDYQKTKSHVNDKSLIAKWWQSVLQVKDSEQKVRRVAIMMKTGMSVSEQDISDICRFIELLEKYVDLPCVAMNKTLDLLSLAFH